jgi:hypothetical protein
MAKGSISALLVTLCLTWPAANALAADDRMAVMLNDEQKSFVLGHMRDMLEALTDTQQLLLDGDREALKARITQLQSREQDERPQGMGKRLPTAFRVMAQSMRPHWQAIGDPETPETDVRRHVVDLMRVCNACHQTFAIR